jgi:nitric oxide reductase subunit B
MSAADIVGGKAGFQKADLMDYGSLYGMGSYFGEDYTAAYLVRLATLTEDSIAKANSAKDLSVSTVEQQPGRQDGDASRAPRRRSDQTSGRHSR